MKYLFLYLCFFNNYVFAEKFILPNLKSLAGIKIISATARAPGIQVLNCNDSSWSDKVSEQLLTLNFSHNDCSAQGPGLFGRNREVSEIKLNLLPGREAFAQLVVPVVYSGAYKETTKNLYLPIWCIDQKEVEKGWFGRLISETTITKLNCKIGNWTDKTQYYGSVKLLIEQ